MFYRRHGKEQIIANSLNTNVSPNICSGESFPQLFSSINYSLYLGKKSDILVFRLTGELDAEQVPATTSTKNYHLDMILEHLQAASYTGPFKSRKVGLDL